MTEINDDIQNYNKDIRNWVNQTRRIIHGKIPMRKKYENNRDKYEESLHRSFLLNSGSSFGEIDRVGFVFSLHGVFLQKGVGRGYVSKNGLTSRGFRSKNPNIKRTDFRSVPGAIVRKPVDWLNGPLQSRFEILSDIVAEHKADQAVINFQRMKIQ